MKQLLALFARNRTIANRVFKADAAADAEDATLYLYDYIVDSDLEAEFWGGVSPRMFSEMLNGITAKTVHLRVNSPGGSVFAARAMEQAIREKVANGTAIHVHVDGLAASAASFLILPATSIEMAPGAMLMIHNAWAWGAGNAQELTKLAELLTKIDGTLVDSYAARSGQAKDAISEKMAAESWFTAQEAVDFGLADTVAEDAMKKDGEKKAQALAAPAWDLEAFAHAPRAEKALRITIDGAEAFTAKDLRALLAEIEKDQAGSKAGGFHMLREDAEAIAAALKTSGDGSKDKPNESDRARREREIAIEEALASA